MALASQPKTFTMLSNKSELFIERRMLETPVLSKV